MISNSLIVNGELHLSKGPDLNLEVCMIKVIAFFIVN